VAGTAAMVGLDFGAKFLASLATAFEEQYEKADSLALRNLTLLFSHLFSFSLVSSELVYELLALLCKRFEELDVSTILILLQCETPLAKSMSCLSGVWTFGWSAPSTLAISRICFSLVYLNFLSG
jgi:hypothetical protein